MYERKNSIIMSRSVQFNRYMCMSILKEKMFIKRLLRFLLFFTPITSQAEYVHYSQIHPAQLSFSSRDVQSKIDEAIEEGNVSWDESSNSWKFKHFQNKSIFPEKKQLSVVKASCGYVLLDGHHKVLASIKLGAHWINIKIVQDVRDMDEDQFWIEAEAKNWADPSTVYGIRAIPPARFEDMHDDPYRWLPFLLKGVVPANGDLAKYKGVEYPVWLKVGDGIPFIEFKIAKALFKNGIVYSYEMGDNLEPEFVERCRAILLKAEIPGLYVVPERMYCKQLQAIQ